MRSTRNLIRWALGVFSMVAPMTVVWRRHARKRSDVTKDKGETKMTEKTAAEAYREFLEDLQGWLMAKTRHIPELRGVVEAGKRRAADDIEHILEFRVSGGDKFRLAFRKENRFSLELPSAVEIDPYSRALPPGEVESSKVWVRWATSTLGKRKRLDRLYTAPTRDVIFTFAYHAVLFAWDVLPRSEESESE